MKKILFIKNIITTKIDLSKFNNNIELKYFESYKLINLSNKQLVKLILDYDIIIIGGGPQHLTDNNILLYPELINQIKIIKFSEKLNKILIGICLGCQLIAFAFGLKIVKMKNLIVGFNLLDISSINYKFFKNDKFLKLLDYDIISNSFSYHNDCIEWKKNDKLNLIAVSKFNVPYIIKHTSKKIYGFQSHPEASYYNVYLILSQFFNIDICNNIIKYFNHNVCIHFFKVFTK